MTLNLYFQNCLQVVNTASLWKWVDDVLIPGLYDVTWYNNQPFEYKEGFISNKLTFLMGMPRMRQLRVLTSKITIITLFHQLTRQKQDIMLRNIK